jgi:hypothetical protein
MKFIAECQPEEISQVLISGRTVACLTTGHRLGENDPPIIRATKEGTRERKGRLGTQSLSMRP